jgi:hypothetical protein
VVISKACAHFAGIYKRVIICRYDRRGKEFCTGIASRRKSTIFLYILNRNILQENDLLNVKISAAELQAYGCGSPLILNTRGNCFLLARLRCRVVAAHVRKALCMTKPRGVLDFPARLWHYVKP